MALFAKKNKTGASPAVVDTPTTGDPANGGFEDFSDFSGDATPDASTAAPVSKKKGRAAKPDKPPRASKPRGLKGGAVVGLNIGADSIKAVELKGKGNQVAVTALGMIPTPPDSISQGVVMSTTALSGAIRELFQKSGIKTKRIITSVAGSGALVVRVIEVPKMSDAELKGNMTQDADRYIPFPPSEVIMDFKALRDLPGDPDSGNMEVLLAAAQREIVDLHINVLIGAKMEPLAIDVEPLAAARALSYNGLGDNSSGSNYGDVWALINMGATNTEISILRGDILVFTRSIPRGANAFTQAISEALGLSAPDAERLKRELGDALPSNLGAGSAAGAANAEQDDWSSFGHSDTDDTTTNAGFDSLVFGDDAPPAQAAPAATSAPVSGAVSGGAVSGGAVSGGAVSGGAVSSDPFDIDLFNQGPQGQEPQERHHQKQDEDGDADNDVIQPAAAQNAPSLPAEVDIHSALHPEETAPRGQMFQFDAVDDPSLPSFPSLPAHLTSSAGDDDFSTVPAVEDDDEPAVGAEPAPLDTPTAAPSPISGFSFGFTDAPAATARTTGTTPTGATPSTDDLAELAGIPTLESSPDSPDAAPGAAFNADEPAQPEFGIPGLATESAETGTPEVSGGATASVFDFNFGSEPQPALGMPTTGVPTLGAAQPDPLLEPAPSEDLLDLDALTFPEVTNTDSSTTGGEDFGSGLDVDAFGTDVFGSADDFGMGTFGAGLVGGAVTNDITADTIYGIIQPLLEEIVGEVRRSLEYFGSRYPDAGVHRITLVGGGAKLTNVDAYLTQSLGIPATVGNPFANVVVRAPQALPGLVDENSPLFAVALGLALRDVV
jgi:type IV pilus assembly protein PilM